MRLIGYKKLTYDPRTGEIAIQIDAHIAMIDEGDEQLDLEGEEEKAKEMMAKEIA